MRIRRVLAPALFAAAIAGACTTEPRTPAAPPPKGAARVVTSNVTRADYAGTAACAPCHGELVARWERSPMHRMTRRAGDAEIRAPFDGRTFRFKDDSATLERHGDARYLRVASPKFGNELFRVTKVIGGRVREDFAGVAVPAIDAPVAAQPHDERILPVSYVIASGELRYKGYSVQARERPGMRAGPVWSKTCIFCHNTVPLLDGMFSALAGPGAGAYQGSNLDALLPLARTRPTRVTDEGALLAALGAELGVLGRAPKAKAIPAALREAIAVTRTAFDDEDVVEIGIGCESCHGGSREHVDDPTRAPTFAPVAPFFAAPVPTAAEAENRACGRCHQVLFSQYPFTYEGGERRGAHPGGSTINSGEARDFLLGGCASAMRCSTCHDPHAKEGEARGRDLATEDGDRICLGCHAKYAGPALAQHTHHAAGGEGSRCVGCHMPRKTMALDGTLGRYHRIGSPTDAARVLGDRPLECALCHVDASVGDLVSAMERWWGKSYDRAALAALYPSLAAPAMSAALASPKAHEQAVAIFSLGNRAHRASAGRVARGLLSPVPLVRYWARDALTRMTGVPCTVNLHQETSAIEAEARAWLGPLGHTLDPSPLPGGAPLDVDEE